MYLFVCRIIILIVFVIVVLLANIIIVAMFAVIVGVVVVVVVNPQRIQLKSQSVSFAYTFSHNNSSNSK